MPFLTNIYTYVPISNYIDINYLLEQSKQKNNNFRISLIGFTMTKSPQQIMMMMKNLIVS